MWIYVSGDFAVVFILQIERVGGTEKSFRLFACLFTCVVKSYKSSVTPQHLTTVDLH